MSIPLYQVDAFASELFRGNPAAVCPLEVWLEDDILQKIAKENNLSETAFFVKIAPAKYQLRWFTPQFEIDLCGHATLASTHVLFENLGESGESITFSTLSGDLLVEKAENGIITLDFPSRPAEAVACPKELELGLGVSVSNSYKSRDYLLEFESEAEIAQLVPDFQILSTLNAVGIIVTAPGNKADFVSRFFAPRAGIDEDPVTGSAHSTLIPFWAKKLEKNILLAEQISERGGTIQCELIGDRVKIGGRAVTYLEGQISI